MLTDLNVKDWRIHISIKIKDTSIDFDTEYS
jgi:hypothetical protein